MFCQFSLYVNLTLPKETGKNLRVLGQDYLMVDAFNTSQSSSLNYRWVAEDDVIMMKGHCFSVD